MSDTSAAIRAAREVQADTLAPELYREANEAWLNAKKDYKYKNFKLASDEAAEARHLAERAEFEAIRNGGTRTQVDAPPDPFFRAPPPAPKYAPYPYPTPTGTPVEEYDQRKAEDEKAKSAAQNAQNNPGGATGTTTAPNPTPNQGTTPSISTSPTGTTH